MKEKLKKVYYCDYCKKKMFVKSAMEKHELCCTANINRHCKMCDLMGAENDIKDIIQKTEKTLAGKYTLCMDIEDDKKTFDEIFDTLNRCPACMLTVMRHYKIIVDGWDFREAMQKEFDSVKEEEMAYIF
jgi:hypothetical protein